jgi:transposase
MKQKKIIQKTQKHFSEAEKHAIIQELIETQCTKVEIWEKYTGQEEEHGQLLRWMKQLGYNTGIKTRRPNIVSNLYPMAQKKIKPDKPVNNNDESFENLQLKKRIADLEKQLKDAELKAIAFSTMVDIAEKEFKIPIRKKLNTKP